MLFARSRRQRPRRGRRLKTHNLAESQVVVCKIRQPPFLVPQALFSTVSFHLLWVVLAIFRPAGRMRPAPFPRTLQADLLIHRIGRRSCRPIFRMVSKRSSGVLWFTIHSTGISSLIAGFRRPEGVTRTPALRAGQFL